MGTEGNDVGQAGVIDRVGLAQIVEALQERWAMACRKVRCRVANLSNFGERQTFDLGVGEEAEERVVSTLAGTYLGGK